MSESLDWVSSAEPTGSIDEQGSQAWLNWRRQGIGASDVPVVMGNSPYKTLKELYEEKIGEGKTFEGNFATRRGQEAEPIIKDLYKKHTNTHGNATTAEYSIWPTLRASFDYYCAASGTLAEFKYPAQKFHDLAKEGIIPYHYFPQVQSQLLVSGLKEMDYVSYDGNEIVVVRVEANERYQRAILSNCKRFWEYVETKRKPPKHIWMEPGPWPAAEAYDLAEKLLDDDFYKKSLARFLQGSISPNDYLNQLQATAEELSKNE